MSMEGETERTVRLASIVAIDVAGFSSMSERDQRRTANKIEALRARIEAVAARNEGRVFNTAGDGFMLEFQSAGAALAAINDLLDSRPRGEPAVRVGAHVGDVVVTINNDLLGHGVNVAARLQSLAPPNTALVSGEFRSMARNSPSAAFQSRGRQPLENIEQKVATFAIVSQKQRTRRMLSRGFTGLVSAAAVAMFAVFAGPQIVRYVDEQDWFARSETGDAEAAAPAAAPAPAPTPESVSASAPEAPPQAVLEPQTSAAPAPGTVLHDCDNCPDMMVVPGGAFMMGSPNSERGHFASESPQHQVTVPSFAISVYEITFAEWDACLADGGCRGYSPQDNGWGRGRHPVIGVSWSDAQSYVQWINRVSGRLQYRLPTEAEWEYAARAGTTTRYAFGDSITASQAKFGGARTDPVGSYTANAFGLYDLHGNAWEWTADCYTPNYVDAPANGSAIIAEPCAQRVYRGGGFRDAALVLRSANRRRAPPELRDGAMGFRVARDLQ
jgi:formylglycine-generating enzyme required for sulfatase activity